MAESCCRRAWGKVKETFGDNIVYCVYIISKGQWEHIKLKYGLKL